MYLVKKINESLIESVGDGAGLRLILFTCGCPYRCKNCQNKETWNIKNGVNYDVKDIYEYLNEEINNGYDNGITFSGGAPLIQDTELNNLIKLIKENHPNLNILVYTGYPYEDIADKPVIKNIDVLVDGKFTEEMQHQKQQYRGSYNQRVLYLQNSMIVKEG